MRLFLLSPWSCCLVRKHCVYRRAPATVRARLHPPPICGCLRFCTDSPFRPLHGACGFGCTLEEAESQNQCLQNNVLGLTTSCQHGRGVLLQWQTVLPFHTLKTVMKAVAPCSDDEDSGTVHHHHHQVFNMNQQDPYYTYGTQPCTHAPTQTTQQAATTHTGTCPG